MAHGAHVYTFDEATQYNNFGCFMLPITTSSHQICRVHSLFLLVNFFEHVASMRKQ